MISTDIRRDLIMPPRHLSQLQLLHFYRKAPYGDLVPADLDDSLIAYQSPLELLRLLQKTRPDIVQNVELFSIRQLPYIAAILYHARTTRKPLIASVHMGRPLHKKYGYALATLLKLILQPVLRYTSIFFYLNEGGRCNLLWMGVPESKLVRLMYGTWGIDPQEFSPIKDGSEPAWGEHPVILFVGRLHAEKGIFDLLRAYGLIQEAVPDARLVFIGDGPHRNQAEQYVHTAGWDGKVNFLGTIKNRHLPAYFRAATVFACPARTTRRWEEYVGMTNIQAMACGVPVVSTLSGAIPEYVPDGQAGLLVPEQDPQALAEAIQRLLDDNELRTKLGRQARLYATEHYNAQLNVQKAEQIILDRCYSPGSQPQKRDTN